MKEHLIIFRKGKDVINTYIQNPNFFHSPSQQVIIDSQKNISFVFCFHLHDHRIFKHARKLYGLDKSKQKFLTFLDEICGH